MMKTLPNGVWIPQFTVESLEDVWSKIKDFDSMFLEKDLKDKETFLKTFLIPSIVLEIEGGMLLFDDVIPGTRARMNLTFWDKNLSEKAEIVRECVLWVFDVLKLERLSYWIPSYASALMRFVQKKLNFKHEGLLRNYFLRKGLYVDTHIYSLLRGEI